MRKVILSMTSICFPNMHRGANWIHGTESESIPPDRSLRDFFVEQLEQKDLTEAEKKTVLQMGEMWGAFVGAPYESQSLKFFWLEECIDGGMFVAS